MNLAVPWHPAQIGTPASSTALRVPLRRLVARRGARPGFSPFASVREGVVAAAAIVVLSGCGLEALLRSPVPPSAPPTYGGDDAATLQVRVEHTDCCYMEGDIDVIQLEGRMTAEWSVGGESVARLAPGEYTLTAFEQVCGGNCGNPAAPAHHCTIDLNLADGESVALLITFPVPGPCTVEVAEGA